MKLLVLGATGSTGRVLVPQALEAGHYVTAIIRSSLRDSTPTDRLTARQASVMDAVVLDELLPGHDAVLSVLGTRRSPRGFASFDLMTKTMSALVPAMQRHQVERLILLSALGVGQTADLAPPSSASSFVPFCDL